MTKTRLETELEDFRRLNQNLRETCAIGVDIFLRYHEFKINENPPGTRSKKGVVYYSRTFKKSGCITVRIFAQGVDLYLGENEEKTLRYDEPHFFEKLYNWICLPRKP